MCNYHKNIQTLLIKVFKMKNELARPVMKSTLNKKFNTYDLRNFQELKMDRKEMVWYGLETLSYRYLQFHNPGPFLVPFA